MQTYNQKIMSKVIEEVEAGNFEGAHLLKQLLVSGLEDVSLKDLEAGVEIKGLVNNVDTVNNTFNIDATNMTPEELENILKNQEFFANLKNDAPKNAQNSTPEELDATVEQDDELGRWITISKEVANFPDLISKLSNAGIPVKIIENNVEEWYPVPLRAGKNQKFIPTSVAELHIPNKFKEVIKKCVSVELFEYASKSKLNEYVLKFPNNSNVFITYGDLINQLEVTTIDPKGEIDYEYNLSPKRFNKILKNLINK